MSTSAVPVIDWSEVLGLVKTKKEHHTAALAALTKLEHAAETLHRTNLSVLELRGQLAGAEEQLEVDRATAAAAHSQALAFLTVEQPAAGAETEQPAAGAETEQPAAAAETEQPAAGAETEQPAAAAETEQPAAGAETEQPAAGAETEHPVAATVTQ